MPASIYVMMNRDHPEEFPLRDGVVDYAERLALDWSVVACAHHHQGLRAGTPLATASPPAVVIGRSEPGNFIRRARARGVKWVEWVYEGGPLHGDAAVAFDSASIGQTAADYLKRTGARSFAVQGPMPNRNPQRTLRHQAFLDAAKRFNAPAGVLYQDIETGGNPFENLADFCDAMPKPIGFFLYHDGMAEYLIRDLLKVGTSIPDQAMVMGCGDITLTHAVQPSISSVRLPYYALGHAAAAQAHKLLSGANPEPLRVRPISVIERNSTLLSQHSHDRVVRRALQRVAREDRPLPSVTALARHCRVQRQVLWSHFLHALKQSPKTWLMERAMQRASRLLAETDLPLDKIAGRCGIAHKTHLVRRFKSRFGITPGRYRSACGGALATRSASRTPLE